MTKKSILIPATPNDLEREDMLSMMSYNYLTALDMAFHIFGELSDLDEDERNDRSDFIRDTYRELNRTYKIRKYRYVDCCGGNCGSKEKN